MYSGELVVAIVTYIATSISMGALENHSKQLKFFENNKWTIVTLLAEQISLDRKKSTIQYLGLAYLVDMEGYISGGWILGSILPTENCIVDVQFSFLPLDSCGLWHFD